MVYHVQLLHSYIMVYHDKRLPHKEDAPSLVSLLGRFLPFAYVLFGAYLQSAR